MRTALARARTGLTALTGTGAGPSLVLAMLVIGAVFVAVAMPRASLAYRTRALRRVIAGLKAPARTVTATTNLLGSNAAGSPVPLVMPSAAVNAIGRQIGWNLTKAGLPLRPAPARWWGLATTYSVAPDAPKAAYNGSIPPQLEVLCRAALPRFSRLASGRRPATSSLHGHSARFQVAVTAATAAKWHLHPGAVLKIDSAVTSITLMVTGVVRPVDAGSSFWTDDPNAAAVTFNTAITGGYWLGAVFVAPSALSHLEAAFAYDSMRFDWVYPLALGSLNANQADQLNGHLSRTLVTAGVLPRNHAAPPDLGLSSGAVAPLARFVRAENQVGSLLALLYVSLAAVSAVVLLLGGQLLAQRRAAEFGLIRARGGSRGQLAVLALRAGAVAVLPAAGIGALMGVAATPGGGQPLAWWLAGATALAALAGVPLLAVRAAAVTAATRAGAEVRPSRAARSRRLVADLTLVAAAAGGIVVVRGQGTPPAGGTNWYTSAAPVLVAIPAAVLLVRLYPVVVRWLVSLAGRRPGVSTFVGLARAVRGSAGAVLPVFALVLALGVIAFGATLRTAVLTGDEAASWRATGADAVVNAAGSSLPLTRARQRAIAAVPGVRRWTAVSVLAGTAGDGTALAVVAVDPVSYSALIAATPLRPAGLAHLASGPGQPSAAGAGSVAVLASPAAAASLRHSGAVLVGVRTVRMRVAGRITSLPGVPKTGPFVVVPERAMAAALGTGSGPPNLMLIVGASVDGSRLTSVVTRTLPGATVTLRSRVLAALTGAPLPHGAQVTFAEGAAAAAGLGAIILAIMLTLGARQRELTLARLLTMGLSPGQARRLVVAEVLPAIVAAAAGGACCAWALVALLGSAVDLSPLTGTPGPIPVRADYAVLGYLACALLALAAATLLAQSAATRLRGVAQALRVSE